jgi:hypothetical protein
VSTSRAVRGGRKFLRPVERGEHGLCRDRCGSGSRKDLAALPISATTLTSSEFSSASLTCTATLTPPIDRPVCQVWTRQAVTPSARQPPRSGTPGTPARPAWTPPFWPDCAAAMTRRRDAG